MKLATLNDGSRDGKLVVVSKDLTRCCAAGYIAPIMQAALDNWERVKPELELLATDVEHEAVPCERFHERQAHSPLPRAYQWADGSAYINHVELVRKARNAEVPESFYHDPLMYQGGSDGFLPPRADIPLGDTAWGCNMEGEVAVIVDDVPMGVSAENAADHSKLVMLVKDVSLRGRIPGELAKGFGFFQSKPASAFSPVAVTPDELGDAWKDSLVHRPLMVDYNGEPFGRAEVGVDATFNMAHNLLQMLHRRPHSELNGTRNCWLVGGCTHPGSGLPTIFLSAQIAARLIGEEAGLPSSATEPELAGV